jgi:hypothetical protein
MDPILKNMKNIKKQITLSIILGSLSIGVSLANINTTKSTLFSSKVIPLDDHATFHIMGKNAYLGAGLFYETLAHSEPNTFTPMISLNVALLDLGFGYVYRTQKGTKISHAINDNIFSGYLGLNLVSSQNNAFVLNGGVAASYTLGKGNDQNNPYSIAPYLGINYQILPSIILTGHLNLITWSVNNINTQYFSVFNSGMVGISYIF